MRLVTRRKRRVRRGVQWRDRKRNGGAGGHSRGYNLRAGTGVAAKPAIEDEDGRAKPCGGDGENPHAPTCVETVEKSARRGIAHDDDGEQPDEEKIADAFKRFA